MRTVTILEHFNGEHVSPEVLDVELSPEVRAVSLTVRTGRVPSLMSDDRVTARILARTWDSSKWDVLASTTVGEHSEKTITAEVSPDRELVRWSVVVDMASTDLHCRFEVEEDK